MNEELKIAIQNADHGKGEIFYGMHFYPGLAGYEEPNGASYKVYLSENTIRSMDPTFAGCPVFVLHVDSVPQDLDELRGEADGWVIESFYNQADGKHWAKFVVVSDKGLEGVRNGMRLSNCYLPKDFGPSGTWNGIDYDKEITAAEYEHLAIVPNPRYEESVIMTPEEFKKYNEDNLVELKRLANNNDKEGSNKMKFSFFKRTKVENSLDLENMLVLLPKTKREVSIEKLINEADEPENLKMAHPDHLVDVGDERLTVKRLADCYKDSMSKMKDDDDEMMDSDDSEKEELDLDKKDKSEQNEDMEEVDREKNEDEEEEEKKKKDSKKKNDLEKSKMFRNARTLHEKKSHVVETSLSQVNRGKELLGSGRY